MSYNLELIQRVLSSQAGAELIRYFSDKLLELDSVMGLNDKLPMGEKGLEAEAQKRAYLKLQEILKQMLIWNEPTLTPKEAEDKKAKDSFR